MYIVNDALINWGGLSDGSDLVAEEIGWFGQGWNSPSHTVFMQLLYTIIQLHVEEKWGN